MKFSSLFVLSLFLFASLCASEDPDGSNSAKYSVVKKSYWFSTEFEFDAPEGKIVRTGNLTPWYYYDYVDGKGNHLSRGITRFFSLGTLFAWAMNIDVYDDNGNTIGLIEGHFWTKARAKFAIYEKSKVVAHAFLNTDDNKFVMTSAWDEKLVIAKLKRADYGDVNFWEVKLTDNTLVDERVLKTFIAFISDYQNSFQPQKEEVHLHYHDQRQNYYNNDRDGMRERNRY